ncbi:hypothetical protein PU088_000578 [Citrobacter farmeri]|uniref:Uncharacterized protein n=1 Tax=Citrobacter amalonaticus Y19 TaxID=1261127 RepID=A0A0F6RGI7_CITAM|nr:hypothetical protein [Citrobacter amalonaticus]AKE60083.1 hypothetical protein F384_16750 [Citrobacter amalonaticus Y19]EKV5653151.1 hypothetical protein [Citrobacter farmeri]
MPGVDSIGKALIILLETFLGNRRNVKEAHQNLLDEYNKENHNLRLIEYWFCTFTGWKYAKYRDICFIMNSSDPSKMLYLARGINYIARTVDFFDNGECRLTDKYNAKGGRTFTFLVICFCIITCVLIGFLTSSILFLIAHHGNSLLVTQNIIIIIFCALFIPAFIFFIHAVITEFFAFEKAAIFTKSYNDEREASNNN